MNLMAGHTPDRSTSSPGGSLASHTAMPDCEKETTTTVRSGLKCLELSEKLGRSGLLGKTLLASSVWTAGVYSGEYSLTWKMRAIGRKHILFQLSVSKRRTKDTGFGLLPTANARDYKGNSTFREQKCLPNIISLLPTPKANKTTGKSSDGFSPNLHEVIEGTKTGRLKTLLPTPRANDSEKRGNIADDKRNGLPGRIQHLLPTPDAGMGKTGDMGGNRRNSTKQMNTETVVMDTIGRNTGMKLQPEFVEWQMGFPQGWTELEAYPPRPKKAKRTD